MAAPTYTSLPTAKTISIMESSREAYRLKVATLFVSETHGSSTTRTDYTYYVEQDSVSGRRVYLQRPASLNKGFDFTIHVENAQFHYKDIPRHDDLKNDLLAKKAEDPIAFAKLKVLFEKVFLCQPIDDAEYQEYPFKTGLSVEIVFKTIKWLFIEQDITYWNWSGREMLYGHLIDCW